MKLLLSALDCIFIKYDSNIIFTLSIDSGILIQIE